MEEETYKVTFHLINGKKLKCSTPVTAGDLMEAYTALDHKEGGRIKFPTDRKTMQFLPASSVLRIEAFGFFEQP